MAQLKDLIVNGASRFIGDIYGNKAQLTTLYVNGTSSHSDYIYRGNYSASDETPMLWMNSKDYDNYLWQISSGTDSSKKQYFGYGLKYIGSGAGVANYLRLMADNQNGTDVTAIGINQSGQVGIGADASTSYRLYVNGTSYHTNTTILSGNGANAPLIIKNGAGNYREGIRIIPSSSSWSDITLGGNDITEASGTSANSWFIGNNNGTFVVVRNGSNLSAGTWGIQHNGTNWLVKGTWVPNATNTYTLGVGGSSPLRWSKLYIGTADSYGSSTQPIYWNAGVPTGVSWYPSYCNIDGQNKANYPWHRFATCDLGTNTYIDKSVIVVIHGRYDGGSYGVIKLSAKSSASGAAIDISATWLVRYGFAAGDVRIAKTTNSTGTQTYVDAYIKCGTYPRRRAYILQGSNNGFSLINSNEVSNTTTSDPLTSVEVYTDVTTAIGYRAYNTVVNSVDGGIVNLANKATAANLTTTANALTYYTNTTGAFGDSAITITKASKHIGGFINGGQKSGTMLGINATAEGDNTTASGTDSHAEGGNTTASGADSHAEGYNTTASGSFSHAEGGNATASGICSHAEGYNTTASASEAHAEGADTTASGDYSHAEGYYTTAQRKSQHVFGEYNVLDTVGADNTARGNYIEIVGNGIDANTRSNARTLDWNGNETIAGNLTAKSLYLFGLNSTNSTRYITSTAANNIAFSISGKYSLVVTDTAIHCGNAVAGTINLGASTHRWNNIYANSVNIAQYIKISNSSNPYIDFHRANSTNQTARVINYLGSDNLEILSMQSQVVALETTSGKVAALYSDGNFANFHGHIIAGAGDSNQQHNITAHSSAGEIYLYSNGSTGIKGIYTTHPNPNNLNPPPQNHVLRVEQNGTVHIGDTNSAVKVVGNIAVETSCVRNIYAGTSDLTDGVSDLTTGAIYLVY